MVYKLVTRVATVVLIVLLVGLALGQLLGQPVFLAYVETDSMEPTIETGDGFIAIPAEVTGSPEVGDVITFDAQEVDGGGITTHRIIDETADGYITRGDNSPFIDQEGGEPPVTEERIVAHVLEVDGEPVTIPYLGAVVETTQSVLLAIAAPIAGALGLELAATAETLGLAVFAVGLGLFVLSVLAENTGTASRDVDRSLTPEHELDARKVAVVVLVIVLVPANLAMVVPSGDTEIAVDGDEVADVEGVAPGDAVDAEFEAQNNALITMVIALEPADPDVTMDRDALALPPGEGAAATAAVPAPPPGEERTVVVSQHRYFQLFPESVIVALHDRSPVLAFGVLNAIIAISVLGFVGGLLGFDRVQFRDTSRNVPLTVKLRRKLRP